MINHLNIDFEKEVLKKQIELQTYFKKIILKYVETIADNAISNFYTSSGNIAYDYLNKSKNLLSKVDEDLEKLNNLNCKLDEYSTDFNEDEANIFLTSYTKIYEPSMKTILDNTLELQNVLTQLSDYIKFNFSLLSNNDLLENTPSIEVAEPDKEIEQIEPVKPDEEAEQIEPIESLDTPVIEPVEVSESIDNNLKENILLISDIKQKVVLPYKISELENILHKDNSFNSLQEVIDKKYTIPTSYYKNSAVSRFREAFNLVKKRSSRSTLEAIDLGMELFFKYDLNPAIITACKNIDELDIYLSCLDDNDLDGFKCFDIVYEGLPTLSK